MTEKANIGVVGLAVMGSNLARNLASREGNRVAIYNRSVEKTNQLTADHPEANFIASESIDDFVASLSKPRTAIIMVQAGAGTDAVISQLTERFEKGDIIVDGGNALYTDTMRREKEVSEKGIHFVGAGISGGEEGALKGPSIMPGGTKEAYATLGPILETIAAVAEGEPCVTHIGSDGAGHFVKMIHNGIEYADMQLIAEAYDLLRQSGGFSPEEIAEIFTEWNRGELESYLIEITAEVLKQKDAKTGKPLVDVILDAAGSKGTGVWTVQTALDLGTPVSGIAEAVFARSLSAQAAQREGKPELPAANQVWEVEDKPAFVEAVRRALYASKIIAYAQGFDAIRAGAKEFGWQINLGEVAKIWRGGCIIRAQFLNRITDAYRKNENLLSLLFDDYFIAAIAGTVASWREIVAMAALTGVPSPAFASSLRLWCRDKGTSLALTPISASTPRAATTPSGRVTAQR
jgi:6-phosphogluconate dehydrogenase